MDKEIKIKIPLILKDYLDANSIDYSWFFQKAVLTDMKIKVFETYANHELTARAVTYRKIFKLLWENSDGMTFKEFREQIQIVSPALIIACLNNLVSKRFITKLSGIKMSIKGLDMPVYYANDEIDFMKKLI